MTIAFVHPHQSFLPEIDAYIHFFSDYGIATEVLKQDAVAHSAADLFWYFMGTDKGLAKKNAWIIHEYGSASVPPFHGLKDRMKRSLAPKPSFRIFLNEYVQQAFGFNDEVPFGFRDMGIDPAANAQAKAVKEFDFIYTGSTAANRDIDRLLNIFIRDEWKEKRLMILSQDYDHLAKKYSAHKNILFEGPVAHDHVAEYILTSKFGINFIPDREPFNRQTSTKFLEYASLKIPIISSRYAWIEEFQQAYGGNYFYLDEDAANFTWDSVTRYDYSFPDLKEWSWEKQIRISGVLEFLHGIVK